jgi:hypothetical protein
LPHLSNSGNVLRPFTSLCLSIRIPPTLSAEKAKTFLKEFFENRTWLYDAKIIVESMVGMSGYNAKELSNNLSWTLN